VRERLAAVWGAVPPAEPGLAETEMTRAAVAGTLRALWVQGQDIAQTDADQAQTLRALERLELLVVQDIFLTDTARRAHVVFPAASYLEQDGTFTSAERRIQRVRAAAAPPGEARPDWEVVRDVARALGAGWDYAGPHEVMDEIAIVAPALFGGVRYDRLSGDGLQWPCPTPDHPGTARLHTQGFRTPARLACLSLRPVPEAPDERFPYMLITGRTLHQFNAGTMTGRSANATLAPDDLLEIHPDDAAAAALADGTPVAVESRWGQARTRARLSGRVPRGALFLSFHSPETHTNRVVGPHLDPGSHCPAYKTTAVRLVPLAGERDG
jgi:predicted molibdopterin-dependent oxidoreductase YjgC